ncbi:LacI family DNA-binding transcriptional regulator [Enterococcus pseudoavium]|uniref:LacI family DNA-binding transcriptional regulator n=1 Tax=Enterococcus pseudoavium TaxID=44007 RepID=A0AAE4I311_9ENTE|nr:LacI family DNA-binding transcriptional regulator [Enterococcus pseudoavium]MDT2736934.1 LacI family DNA-binding transcriptional regulator [Enterococcus pseudoavium]
MANIRDIAKITGYSVSTISRVINHHPYVDDQKRARVLEVMTELNYVPNRSAQNLSYGRTKNIGVILPFVNHDYYDQLLSGIMQAAFDHGYQISLLPTNYDQELEKRYLVDFSKRSFDGLIVTTKANSIRAFLDYLQYGPIIFCEEIPNADVSCVYINLKKSIKEAFAYMKENGVVNPGMTLGRSKNISHNSEFSIQKAKEIYPNFNEANIFWDCIVPEDGIQGAVFFKKRKVDGILTFGDTIAATILQQYEGNKPLVIGRENLLISEVMGFSTIDHHLAEYGKKAFEAFYYDKHEKTCVPHHFTKR